MRWQEIANATPEPSSAKRKASGSSSSHPLLDATADSDVPRPLPSPSKRPVSTIEVQAEDATEHQHTHKRARTEGEATATEDGEVRGSDCSSDTRRSISPWPGIDEIESQQEDPSEVLRHRKLYEEIGEARNNAISSVKHTGDSACSAFRARRLPTLMAMTSRPT